MAKYIEREAAIDRLEKLFQLQASTARAIIEAIPSADVAPVRHGRWENSKACFGEMCSECKFIVWWDDDGPHKFNYCPNCWAKMDGGET